MPFLFRGFYIPGQLKTNLRWFFIRMFRGPLDPSKMSRIYARSSWRTKSQANYNSTRFCIVRHNDLTKKNRERSARTAHIGVFADWSQARRGRNQSHLRTVAMIQDALRQVNSINGVLYLLDSGVKLIPDHSFGNHRESLFENEWCWFGA